MKAVVINAPGEVALKEVERPRYAPGEVLLRIQYVGFCGSDLSSYLGKNPLVTYPRVPGHEISAVITGLGEEVPADYSTGDHVTVVPYTNCGKCPACRRGRSNACRDNQTLGVQRDGAMQEFITVPWQKVLKAPGLTGPALAMVEPLTVGFHAIRRGRVHGSDLVMVLGCGMIGAGAIAGAVLREATVVAVDIDDTKLETARLLGAQHAINPVKSDLHEELDRITGGDGADVVVEAAGNPLTYRSAVEEVAFTGRVVCIGYTGSEVSLPTGLFVQKEMDIMGSRNAELLDFQEVISFLEHGNFPFDRMITGQVKPENAASSLKEWAADPGKTMKILVDFEPINQ
jgi:2-desacetyl-2-hydroxyethyl bacteriochlorophyllide A dehydrogenase